MGTYWGTSYGAISIVQFKPKLWLYGDSSTEYGGNYNIDYFGNYTPQGYASYNATRFLVSGYKSITFDRALMYKYNYAKVRTGTQLGFLKFGSTPGAEDYLNAQLGTLAGVDREIDIRDVPADAYITLLASESGGLSLYELYFH